jgi:hypothetical protein
MGSNEIDFMALGPCLVDYSTRKRPNILGYFGAQASVNNC